MITNLLFTALCLALVLLVTSDVSVSGRELRRVRVRRDDASRPSRN